MRITLTKLRIINFKGIRNFEVYFDLITTIFGANASGKTTVFDAFLWLFFGKNSEDKSKFEIKPLDKNNNFIKNVETEVEAIILVDGQEIAVRKVLRQNWVTPKASAVEKYNGDVNTYFWNDVPLKESEFNTKIKGIVGEESLFRLITNPFYFNNLNWQERRQILMDIAGEVSHYEVLDKVMNADNKNLFDEIVKALNQKKTLSEYQAEIVAKKKKIRDERDLIPSRIDEVKRGRPEAKDFKKIKKEVTKLQAELNNITASLNDEASKLAEENKLRTNAQREYNNQVQAKQRKVYEIKTKLQNIELEVKIQAKESGGNLDAEYKSAQSKLADLKLDETKYANSIASFQKEVDTKNVQVNELYDKCDSIEEELFSFDETNCTCPTCKQTLPAGDIETKKESLLTNFNNDKRRRLDDAIAKGKALKNDITVLQQRIENGQKTIHDVKIAIGSLETKILELQEKLNNAQSVDEIKEHILQGHDGYKQLQSDLAATEGIEIIEPEFEPLQTDAALKEKQLAINNQINLLQRELAIEEQITKADARINELTEQESALSQKLAELEGIEFAILEFTKAKMDIIDQRINDKFKYVRFKMFDRQTNGQEVPTCQTLISSNGSPVPFDSANNAARINAGIDIINALSDHYNVYAPVFVDNAESITDIIESYSQLIRLVVMKGAKLSIHQPEVLENVA